MEDHGAFPEGPTLVIDIGFFLGNSIAVIEIVHVCSRLSTFQIIPVRVRVRFSRWDAREQSFLGLSIFPILLSDPARPQDAVLYFCLTRML